MLRGAAIAGAGAAGLVAGALAMSFLIVGRSIGLARRTSLRICRRPLDSMDRALKEASNEAFAQSLKLRGQWRQPKPPANPQRAPDEASSAR